MALNAERLEDLLAPPDPLLVQSKEKELALAEASLAEAGERLARLQEQRELGLTLELPAAAPGTGEGINTAALDDVSESLRRELLGAQMDIEEARLDLWEAKESLNVLDEPSAPALVALLRAQVATAELEVEEASQRLRGVSLTSPIAGVVTEVYVRSGDHVDRGAVAMTIVDSGAVEVRGAVDETGVLHIQVGEHANVLLRALPGRVLPGAISYVSPTADIRPGAVTYDVLIGVETPEGDGAALRADRHRRGGAGHGARRPAHPAAGPSGRP